MEDRVEIPIYDLSKLLQQIHEMRENQEKMMKSFSEIKSEIEELKKQVENKRGKLW